jgi:hypothetical protein
MIYQQNDNTTLHNIQANEAYNTTEENSVPNGSDQIGTLVIRSRLERLKLDSMIRKIISQSSD